MVKQKKRTRITQSGKNGAIQGPRLIWKQKIWLAICEFLWSLTNQNAWFVTSFCSELTIFCTVLKKECTALNNQNGEIFACILLDTKFECFTSPPMQCHQGVLAMTTATARKTSLGKKHRPNRDYFRLFHLVCILYCWQSTLQVDWCARRWIKYRELEICGFVLKLSSKL